MHIRISVVAALLVFMNVAAASANANTNAAPERAAFEGTWLESSCLPQQRLDRCGWVQLDLVQHGDRVCGRFAAQSGDGERADGGRVVGVALGRSAVVTISSEVRDGSVFIGRMDRARNTLKWKASGLVLRPDPEKEDYGTQIPWEVELSSSAGSVGSAGEECEQ